jgi:hypothetical protein
VIRSLRVVLEGDSPCQTYEAPISFLRQCYFLGDKPNPPNRLGVRFESPSDETSSTSKDGLISARNSEHQSAFRQPRECPMPAMCLSYHTATFEAPSVEVLSTLPALLAKSRQAGQVVQRPIRLTESCLRIYHWILTNEMQSKAAFRLRLRRYYGLVPEQRLCAFTDVPGPLSARLLLSSWPERSTLAFFAQPLFPPCPQLMGRCLQGLLRLTPHVGMTPALPFTISQ